jgi:hypothetical protein
MNLKLKLVFSSLLYSSLIISTSNSQPIQTVDNKLNLADLGNKIENSISFNTSDSNYEKICAITGQL